MCRDGSDEGTSDERPEGSIRWKGVGGDDSDEGTSDERPGGSIRWEGVSGDGSDVGTSDVRPEGSIRRRAAGQGRQRDSRSTWTTKGRSR